MKSKINIKSIIVLSIIGIISLFFINMSLATSTGKIKVDTANLRETADENAKILELLSMNKKVEIIEKEGNWYKVKADGITGYLREDLLTIEGEVTPKENTTTNEQTNQTNSNTSNETQNQQQNQQQNQEQNQEQNQTTTQAEQTENTPTTNTIPESTAVESQQEEIQLGKNVVKETTKIKIVPVINATDVSEIQQNEEVNVIEIVNDWVCIETTTSRGWIRKEKLQKQNTSTASTTEQNIADKNITEQNITDQNITEQNTTTQNTTEQTTTTQNAEVQPTENTNQAQTTTPTTNQTNAINKTLYVKEATVNLRQQANTTSSIISILSINTAVNAIEESNGWYKVKVNGVEGYILKSLLSEQKQATSRSQSTRQNTTTQTTNNTQQTTNQAQATQTTTNNTQTTTSQNKNASSTTNTSATASSKGSSVAATAKQYVGSKYKWGGTSPSTGFDCSGFAQYVYKQYGVSLNRTAAAQTGNGTAVSKSNLQPGDLVFFGKGGINHVGIYIGGGQMVHAANTAKGVRTDNITSGYYNNNYVCARRIM